MNICGCLVHTRPEAADVAVLEMERMPGVEVHARSDDGRVVVVVEDTEGELASEKIMALHQIPNVVSLTLTYHHFEDPSETRSGPIAKSSN